MIEVYTTEEFDSWFGKLRDQKARARIQARIDRIELGNFGDFQPVGEGISELRIFYGPGYRVYFTKQTSVVIVLLVGGNKSSQDKDIKRAKKLARELEI
jgi:putative addiction module killer protein